MQIKFFNTKKRHFKKLSDFEEVAKIVREITRRKYEKVR